MLNLQQLVNNQNHAWQQKIKDAFRKEYGSNELMMEKSKIFNIRNSILDFFEYINNYSSFLRKHFSYPELISFSSKYFYNDGLQTIKVRAKDISEVIVFDQIEHDDLIDIRGNINVLEAEHIVKMLENTPKKSTDLMSVGIITPFRDQQRYISALIDKSSKRNDIYSKLKIKVMTFLIHVRGKKEIILFILWLQQEVETYVMPY